MAKHILGLKKESEEYGRLSVRRVRLGISGQG